MISISPEPIVSVIAIVLTISVLAVLVGAILLVVLGDNVVSVEGRALEVTFNDIVDVIDCVATIAKRNIIRHRVRVICLKVKVDILSFLK